MGPHYSQSSLENATPSSGTSPLASLKGVPSPGESQRLLSFHFSRGQNPPKLVFLCSETKRKRLLRRLLRGLFIVFSSCLVFAFFYFRLLVEEHRPKKIQHRSTPTTLKVWQQIQISQIPIDYLFDIRIYKLWGQWLGTLRFLRGVGIILKHQISEFLYRCRETEKSYLFT